MGINVFNEASVLDLFKVVIQDVVYSGGYTSSNSIVSCITDTAARFCKALYHAIENSSQAVNNTAHNISYDDIKTLLDGTIDDSPILDYVDCDVEQDAGRSFHVPYHVLRLSTINSVYERAITQLQDIIASNFDNNDYYNELLTSSAVIPWVQLLTETRLRVFIGCINFDLWGNGYFCNNCSREGVPTCNLINYSDHGGISVRSLNWKYGGQDSSYCSLLLAMIAIDHGGRDFGNRYYCTYFYDGYGCLSMGLFKLRVDVVDCNVCCTPLIDALTPALSHLISSAPPELHRFLNQCMCENVPVANRLGLAIGQGCAAMERALYKFITSGRSNSLLSLKDANQIRRQFYGGNNSGIVLKLNNGFHEIGFCYNNATSLAYNLLRFGKRMHLEFSSKVKCIDLMATLSCSRSPFSLQYLALTAIGNSVITEVMNNVAIVLRDYDPLLTVPYLSYNSILPHVSRVLSVGNLANTRYGKELISPIIDLSDNLYGWPFHAIPGGVASVNVSGEGDIMAVHTGVDVPSSNLHMLLYPCPFSVL